MDRYLKIIFIGLIIGFICMIVASKGGYYEYKLGEKVNLTDEAIKKFEEDIKNGKDIVLEDYVDTEVVDYNNNVSKLGKKISTTIQKTFTKGMKYIFSSLDNILNN